MERPPKRGKMSGEHVDDYYDSSSRDLPAEFHQRSAGGGRCRLFVGNVPTDVHEPELRDVFAKYGDLVECFASHKGFAFIRYGNRSSAEAAKVNLDGYNFHGRPLRIRFAASRAAVRVKELSPFVSNELLHQAFSMFGEVTRAVHIVDDHGRPTGEGVVEFDRKAYAVEALKHVNQGIMILCDNGRPVVAEPYEPKDEDDGLPEKLMVKNAAYGRQRQVPPHFAQPGTLEFDFGSRWKQLYEVEARRRELLEKELQEGRAKLESEMDFAQEEYHAMMLREDLQRRQKELERLEAARRERIELLHRGHPDRMHPMHQPRMPVDMYPHNLDMAPPPGHPMAGHYSPIPNGRPRMPGPERHPQGNHLFQGVQKLLDVFAAPPPPPPPMPPNMGGHPPVFVDYEMHGLPQHRGQVGGLALLVSRVEGIKCLVIDCKLKSRYDK